MEASSGQRITIADRGRVEHLTYAGLLRFHGGDSWFGLSVGFRALQLAGITLSAIKLWDRRNLHVLSGHSGPGVRDAIEYVTHCISRKRFHLTAPAPAACSPDTRFEWRVCDGAQAIEVCLRTGFVPTAFFELLDRRARAQEQPADHQRFDDLKRELSARLWRAPLEESFDARMLVAGANSHA